MKKGFLYYCLIVSLIFHTLFVFFLRIENAEDKKKKEPLVIDLLGEPQQGPVTRLPEGLKESKNTTVAPREKGKETFAKAPSVRPSASFFPVPSRRPAQPSAPAPRMSPPMPQDHGSTPAPPGQAPHPAPQNPAQAPSEKPSRIVGPTPEDLMRYAKLERETEKTKDKESITLDTDDLMYTSYLQSLKSRIEMIWKYPETARREGLQGNLVMRFSIGKSGRVEGIDIIKSSGYPELDEAARQALLDASPFNPLPDSWKKDSFNITGTFVYRLYGGLYLR
jgi:TonB family protein